MTESGIQPVGDPYLARQLARQQAAADVAEIKAALDAALPFIRWAVDSYRHGGIPPHFTQEDQVAAFLAVCRASREDVE